MYTFSHSPYPRYLPFDLIIGRVRLKLFGLINSARAQRDAGVLMQLLCQTCLHASPMVRHTLVLWVVIEVGFSHHESSRHIQITLVLDSNNRFLLFQMLLQIHFRLFAAFATGWHAHMNHINVHGIVQSEFLTGLNHAFKFGEDPSRG